MQEKRTISTTALLELGDINGLLHELNGQRPVDNSGGSPPPPKLSIDNPPNAGGKTQKSEGKTEAKCRKSGVTANNNVSAVDDDAARHREPVENKKEENRGPRKQESKQKSSVTAYKDTANGGAWDEIQSILGSYKHSVNRDTDSVVWMEHDIIETLRGCYGTNTRKFLNALALWYIDTFSDRLLDMQTKRSPLLQPLQKRKT